MSDFNPGEGWREVQYSHELEGHEHIEWNSTGLAGRTERMWVREIPRPALPTADYTVIVAVVRTVEIRGTLTLIRLGGSQLRPWYGVFANATRQFADDEIGSFEVKAEPRGEAWVDLEQHESELKIVRRDSVESIAAWFEREGAGEPHDDWRRRTARTIRREFGVQS